MAPSSTENKSPMRAGLSCHWLANCAATAGAVIRMVGVMAANSTIAAKRAVIAGVEMGIFKLQERGQNTCTRRNNASVPA